MASAKRPYIMMGKAQTVNLRPTSQVEKVVARLRQKAPFPFTIDELLQLLLPKDFLSFSQRVRDGTVSLEERNMMRLLVGSWDSVVCHVRMGAPDDVFWFRSEVLHSTMIDVGNAQAEFSMPPCRMRDRIMEWATTAGDIERSIDEMVSALSSMINGNINPRQAYAMWPQLQSIVKLPVSSAGSYMKQDEARQLLLGISEQQREKIASMYADALMLPDRVEIVAWVGRHYGLGEQ